MNPYYFSPLHTVDAPEITTQPANQVDINEGTNAVFSVVASGALLSYQWKKGGNDISDDDGPYSGTTTNTLTVLSVDSSDEGDYTVCVINEADTVTSDPAATLTVCKYSNNIIYV